MKWRTDNYAMLSFENLFTFLSYPHVPYDNNASERGAIVKTLSKSSLFSFISLLYLDLHFDDNISWSYVEGMQRF